MAKTLQPTKLTKRQQNQEAVNGYLKEIQTQNLKRIKELKIGFIALQTKTNTSTYAQKAMDIEIQINNLEMEVKKLVTS